MTPTGTNALAALGRVLLSLLFITSGYAKLMASAGTIQYMASQGIPLPNIAYGVSVLVELGGGLAILFGLGVRVVAPIMALFCLATAAMVHYVPGNAEQMINFWKNLSMAGGFLTLAAFGISASLAALGGAIEVLGVRGFVRADWHPNYGLMVVPLVFLARFNGIAVIALVAFFAVMLIGGESASRRADLPNDFLLIVMSLILVIFAVTGKVVSFP